MRVHTLLQLLKSVAKSAENFSHDVGLTQCSVNGLIH